MADETDLEEQYQLLLQKLPSRAPIYLPTDKIPVADKIKGIEHVIEIYKHDLDAVYRPKLRALRERFKGSKRCFLIGNGPSLNQTDLSMLKNDVTFAVNGFFLKVADLNWKPTFYVVEDHLVAEDRAKWINEFKGPIKLFPSYLGYMFEKSDDTIFYNHRPRKSYPHGFDFSLEADKITYTGCTVTFSMMQLATYLGFEEIYLIGVDASYDIPKDAQEGKDYSVGVLDMKSDDPNHFDPDYFGKGFRWHDPQVEKMVEAYAEARKVLEEQTTQRIYNAGIGGKLKVFDRVPFASLFPLAKSPEVVAAENEAGQAKKNAAKFPNLLVLDMTPMGNGTATGEIKSNLLGQWPKDRILQIARHGMDSLALVRPLADGGYSTIHTPRATILREVAAFNADVILYRPVPDVTWLHQFAMDLIQKLKLPLVTWVMDDWQSRLAETDTVQARALLPDVEKLFAQSVTRLSICSAMSEAFKTRYGVNFVPIANGVNPADWPAPRKHAAGPLLVRYSGGLAADMTRDSVLRVASAVERLADAGMDIRLEINTQKWWLDQSGALFAPFKHTTIGSDTLTPEGYRAWLCGADVVVIAYNYDAETLRYVRYSMANKTPECLASGAVLLAIGPMESATIGYLASTHAAMVVNRDSDTAVVDALRLLQKDPDLRTRLSAAGHALAGTRHNVATLREQLRGVLMQAAQPPVAAVQPAPRFDSAVQLELDQLRQNFVALTGYAGELDKRLGGGLNAPVVLADSGDLIDRLKTAVGASSARLLLTSVGSALLSNAADTLRRVEQDDVLRGAITSALDGLADTDAHRRQYLRVQQRFAAR